MLAETPKKTTKELWPRVRPTPCCKCSAYFESEAPNTYVAVCNKQSGWDCGLDVDGNIVAYCLTHALPRVEWAKDLIYVRADAVLVLEVFPEAARYVIDHRSDTGEYSARVDWRSARLESRVKYLEKINARLMKALLGGFG